VYAPSFDNHQGRQVASHDVIQEHEEQTTDVIPNRRKAAVRNLLFAEDDPDCRLSIVPFVVIGFGAQPVLDTMRRVRHSISLGEESRSLSIVWSRP
jgi:hypothetical protein